MMLLINIMVIDVIYYLINNNSSSFIVDHKLLNFIFDHIYSLILYKADCICFSWETWKRMSKSSNFMLKFISFLSNNWKIRPITIGIFSYWIGISYGRHVNSSFSDKFTCFLRKEYARNFIYMYVSRNWNKYKWNLLSI